jgi:hypothetical protein
VLSQPARTNENSASNSSFKPVNAGITDNGVKLSSRGQKQKDFFNIKKQSYTTGGPKDVSQGSKGSLAPSVGRKRPMIIRKNNFIAAQQTQNTDWSTLNSLERPKETQKYPLQN